MSARSRERDRNVVAVRGLLRWINADQFRAIAAGLAILTASFLFIGTFRLVGGPSGSTVTGTVVEVIRSSAGGETGGFKYNAVVSYELDDGTRREFRSGFGSESTSVGDSVTVYFDPDNPKGTNSTDADRYTSITNFYMLALLAGPGAWLFQHRSREGAWPGWMTNVREAIVPTEPTDEREP